MSARQRTRRESLGECVYFYQEWKILLKKYEKILSSNLCWLALGSARSPQLAAHFFSTRKAITSRNAELHSCNALTVSEAKQKSGEGRQGKGFPGGDWLCVGGGKTSPARRLSASVQSKPSIAEAATTTTLAGEERKKTFNLDLEKNARKSEKPEIAFRERTCLARKHVRSIRLFWLDHLVLAARGEMGWDPRGKSKARDMATMTATHQESVLNKRRRGNGRGKKNKPNGLFYKQIWKKELADVMMGPIRAGLSEHQTCVVLFGASAARRSAERKRRSEIGYIMKIPLIIDPSHA